MDDHELSDQFHRLESDTDSVLTHETPEPILCDRCSKVIAAFEAAEETLWGQSYADAKLFVSEIDLDAILRSYCFLCRRLFRNVQDWQGEMKRLVDGLPVVVEYFRRVSEAEHFILVYFQGERTPICNLTILASANGELLHSNPILI